MQQFILEEQLEVICEEDGGEFKEIVEFETEEFIQVMLQLHRRQIQVGNGEAW